MAPYEDFEAQGALTAEIGVPSSDARMKTRAPSLVDAVDTPKERRLVRMAFALLLLAAYIPTLAAMARLWGSHPYAGHGMFVPAFSAMFLWLDRDHLRAATVRAGDSRGLPVILFALLVLIVGRWMNVLLIEGVAVVIAVAGSVLWLFGAACLRAAAFPVGFLIFMVPLPSVVVDAVTLHLQRFAAGVAGVALDALAIPFYQSDLSIFMSTVTLNVAETCNGLRFLTALLVVTTAFAQASQRTLRRKLILVIATIPIAILANSFRVTTIAMGVHYIGPEAASGIIHNSIAKGVWGVTLGAVAVLGFLLRRRGARAPAYANRATPRASLPHDQIERTQ
jgi:exosortase